MGDRDLGAKGPRPGRPIRPAGASAFGPVMKAAGRGPVRAARHAFSSKLSVTDGDVVVEVASDHPESIRRDRARLLDQCLQPTPGGLRSSVATCGEPSDGPLNAAEAGIHAQRWR